MPPLSNIIFFGVIGVLGLFGGVVLIGMGDPLEGVPGIAIGVLLLYRSWRDLKIWAD